VEYAAQEEFCAAALFWEAANVVVVPDDVAPDVELAAQRPETNRTHRRKTIAHSTQVRSDYQSVSSALSASVSVAAAGVAAV